MTSGPDLGPPPGGRGAIDSAFTRRIQRLGPGYVFGERFVIVSELGRGAAGVVYRARERSSERDVALKILSTTSTDTTRSRFRREGELTAALRHPGIVAIHSGGELEGLPYLAYELIPQSRTLASVLPTLSLDERVRLLIEVCEAVGYAHSRGVVHRDLKPDNVLVTPEGSPRVADFGIAGGVDLERLTQTGALVGTPSYMSPEQITGARESFGPHSDVWALGVILFEALTGALPFRADSLMELAAAIVRQPAPPLRRVNPRVSQALETVCAQALHQECGGRYPDANALAADLKAALSGKPLSASSLGGGSGWGAHRLSSPGARLGILVVLAALGSGAIGVVALTREPKQAAASPTPSPTPREPAGRAAREALDAALAQSNALERLRALEAWVAAHPDHERRARALETLKPLAKRLPFQRYAVKDTRALAFLGPSSLCSISLHTLGRLKVSLWDVSVERSEPVWETTLNGTLHAFASSPKGDVAIAGTIGWLGKPRALRRALPTTPPTRAVTFDAQGERVAFGHGEEIVVLRASDGKELWRKASPRPLINGLAFSPKGDRLAATVGDRMRGGALVCVWDLDSGTYEEATHPLDEPILAFSPDGSRLLLGDGAGSLWIHDGATGAKIESVTAAPREGLELGSKALAHLGTIVRMIFLEGDRLLSCDRASKTRLSDHGSSLATWSPEGKELHRVSERGARWWAMDLSPDRTQVAVATKDEIVIRSAWWFRPLKGE